MRTLKRIESNGPVHEENTEVVAARSAMKKGTYNLLDSNLTKKLSKDEYIARLEAELQSFRGLLLRHPKVVEYCQEKL